MLLVMRIFDLKLLVFILSLLSATLGFNLKCVDDGKLPGICVVVDLVITSPDDAITSVNEITDPSESYTSLQIQNQDVKYVPKGIAIFFPKLENLEISNSKLQWIEQDDIKGLVHLKTLDLNGNNLQILEGRLFDFNTELREIKLRGNQLEFLHEKIFYKLENLKIIDLHNNTCWEAMYSEYQRHLYIFKDANNNMATIPQYLKSFCQKWETAHEVYKRRFNEKVISLQSEIRALKSDLTDLATLRNSDLAELTHRLSACDRNFDAALENLHRHKFMNSKTVEANQSAEDPASMRLNCAAPTCVAADFKFTFSNLSINLNNYSDPRVTSLQIHLQQTLFMPQNLADLFPRLSHLSVTESGLFEIEHSVFEGFDLNDLNVSKSKIVEVPADAFADMGNLKALDLSYNKIHTLPDDVFANLKALQKLYLNQNYLISIKVELLKNLESLKELKLNNNRVKFIGATLLSPLKGLELVDLSSNVCINMQHPTSTLMEVEQKIIDNCTAPVDLDSKRNEKGEIAVGENV
ncbi:Slit like 1 protein [Pseudolycoriella hygida]|uniref:Slit like 1 protein n=1 Tax=Pseudolycoriella hygida TaxID=35572 RepID=A0A9Q0ML65_9DIPT|nr:Slit like 1 protein [Pseudolycoriella hygida]